MGLEVISQAYTNYLSISAAELGVSVGIFTLLITFVSLWALVWKGFALWKSASKKSSLWFIILLIVNTLGLLEILYIFIFSKMTGKKQEKPLEKKSKKNKK